MARAGIWSTLALIFIVFTSFLILNLPQVQNYLASRVTTILSKELGTKVSVGNLSIKFLNKVSLNDFYVEDLKGDTLLYSGILDANFNISPKILWERKLKIEGVTLTNAQLKLKRNLGEPTNNMGFIIEYLSKSQNNVNLKEPTKSPFAFNVKQLTVINFDFLRQDIYQGEDLRINSGRANILIENLDLIDKQIEISSIYFNAPIVDIVKYDFADEFVSFPDMDPSPLVVTVDDINIREGSLYLINNRSPKREARGDDKLDFNNLDVHKINMKIKDFVYQDWTFKAAVEDISAMSDSGFILESLSSELVTITPTKTELYGLKLVTPHSILQDSLVFRYSRFPDWRSFPDKVFMSGSLQNCKVQISDVMEFIPAMERVDFFRNNHNAQINLEGRFLGKVNSLKGRDLTLSLADKTFIKGDFSSRNILVQDEQYLNFRLDRLTTDILTLQSLIPRLSLPPNFEKLGKLDFNGQFNGFLTDFVAFGNLSTDLGKASLDMRMNLIDGKTKAQYSGKLALVDFALNRWTGNNDLDKITFESEVKNGIGLTNNTAQADLSAKIKDFSYKGYIYDNLVLQGNLKDRFFNGKMDIKDENLDFDFEGKIDFTGPNPLFDLSADVNKLALKPLKLSDTDLVIACYVNELNLQNLKISEILGSAQIGRLKIVKNAQDTFVIDTIGLISKVINENNNEFSVYSDIAELTLSGQYDLNTIPQQFAQYLRINFPKYYRHIPFQIDTNIIIKDIDFAFEFEVKDSKNIQRLINSKLGTLDGLKLKGHLNNKVHQLDWDIYFPSFVFDPYKLDTINFYGSLKKNFGNINLDIFESQISPKVTIPPLQVLGLIDGDTIQFATHLISKTELLDNLNLDGKVSASNDYIGLSINNSAIVFLSDIWSIEEGNFIQFGRKYINAQNFNLTSGNKTIKINSKKNNGLSLNVDGFDLKYINKVWKYDNMNFEGNFTLNAQAKNVFDLHDINAYINVDTFKINHHDWGQLRIDVGTKNLNSPINTFINLSNDLKGQQLTIKGYYNPPSYLSKNKNKISADQSPNYLNFDCGLSKFPITWLEYLIPNGISDTEGYLDSNFKLYGNPKFLSIDGLASVHELGVTVDYLKTRYYADNQILRMTGNKIDATGGIISDQLGNSALIAGHLFSNHLRDWGLDIGVTSDRFMMLNTTKEDNKYFYGTAIGQGDVQFTGTFRNTDINIKAITAKGTNIDIPITDEAEASEVSFIKFKPKKDSNSLPNSNDDIQIKPPTSNQINGISLLMSVEITNNANLRMVFNENTGDIIQSIGTGNIQFSIDRGINNFIMRGNYQVESGKYLFTFLDIVNKPFLIKRGGTITWEGDPFEANVNLEAEYSNLTAAPYNFIQEYLSNEDSDIIRLANQATDVDLTMLIKGKLLKPEIYFDLRFPRLPAPLQNYVDSKLRIVKNDQNELNRQVFGLLIAGQFFPSEATSFNTGQAISNTLNELLSQQLSSYLTNLVRGWLSEDGFISGIDFDIDYYSYQQNTIDNTTRAANELSVKVRNYLFNDKLAIYGGVNLDLDNPGSDPLSGGAFYGGDFAIEYFLSPDQQFKIKFYQSIQPDLNGERRNKTGLGLEYQQEFDSFREFLAGMKKSVHNISKKNK